MTPMPLTESQVVILYFLGIKYYYIDQSAVCVAYSFHMIYDYATHLNHSYFYWNISHHGATEI